MLWNNRLTALQRSTFVKLGNSLVCSLQRFWYHVKIIFKGEICQPADIASSLRFELYKSLFKNIKFTLGNIHGIPSYLKLLTCRPSISYSGFPVPTCPGPVTTVEVVGSSARHPDSGPIYDAVALGTASWCRFLSRLEARYSARRPATRIPAKNAPIADPITLLLLTGKLTAFPVPVAVTRHEATVAVPVVPVGLDWDCWLEKPKDVRLKGKEPTLLLQHVVSSWLLQHQLESDPFQHGFNEYSSTSSNSPLNQLTPLWRNLCTTKLLRGGEKKARCEKETRTRTILRASRILAATICAADCIDHEIALRGVHSLA